jgi:hypothetical protein
MVMHVFSQQRSVQMTETTRKPYSTDLTDQQWAIIEPLVPPAKHGGTAAPLAFAQLDKAKCPRLTKIWVDNKHRSHELNR